MQPKPNQLVAFWSRRERDIMLNWGEGCSKGDARLLHEALGHRIASDMLPFTKELEARGYDITTIKFSIRKKQPQTG